MSRKRHGGAGPAMRPGKRHRDRAVIATPAGLTTAGPFLECPGEEFRRPGSKDRSGTAETLCGSVHKSPERH